MDTIPTCTHYFELAGHAAFQQNESPIASLLRSPDVGSARLTSIGVAFLPVVCTARAVRRATYEPLQIQLECRRLRASNRGFYFGNMNCTCARTCQLAASSGLATL